MPSKTQAKKKPAKKTGRVKEMKPEQLKTVRGGGCGCMGMGQDPAAIDRLKTIRSQPGNVTKVAPSTKVR